MNGRTGSLRVAIDIQNLLLPKTGVGHYVYELAKSLSALNADADFLFFYFNRNRSLNLPFLSQRAKEHRIASRRIRLYGQIWKYLQFPAIDRFLPEVDVYHFPNFFIRPFRRGKCVLTIHDLSFIRYPQYTEPKNLAFLTRQVKHAVKRADKIIADSNFTRNEIIDIYSIEPSKVVTVYPGIRHEFGQPVLVSEIESIRKKYNLFDPFILFVGTIEPRKNLLGLVEGFRIMRESSLEYKNVRLVVCGMPGWLCETTIKRMEKPDVAKNITRIGYVPDEDLPALYSAAEALALPSWYEGFGFPCVEAIANGVPVLCSKDSSMSEICGETAILVEPGRPENIAAGLIRIFTDSQLKESFARNGRELVKKFTWEHTAKQTYDVYRSVL
jgi:O-antigen biosynthesis alpha-1,3-mannosyltransferase